MMTKAQVLDILSDVECLPFGGKRTIYEWGEGSNLAPSGRYGIDFAAYGKGSPEEVPRHVIDELASEGYIVTAFKDATIGAWILARQSEPRP